MGEGVNPAQPALILRPIVWGLSAGYNAENLCRSGKELLLVPHQLSETWS
jgi:hypothetical protein